MPSELFSKKGSFIFLSVLLLVFLGICPASLGGTADLKEKIPDPQEIIALPKSKVGLNYIDELKQAADFDDYQVGCHLLTLKEDNWKNFGGARLFYKRAARLRAVIESSDYRDGSVIVKQPDGVIRGRGGGLLKAMKMTIEPDSRTIRLPTGYSLAGSDFLSLYESVKSSLAKGQTASLTKSAVTIRQFRDPVQVLVLNTGVGPDSQVTEVVFLDPRSKLPLAWNTYKNGKPSAIVYFEGFASNKGLTDEFFKI